MSLLEHHTCRQPDTHNGSTTDRTGMFPPAGQVRWFSDIAESVPTLPNAPNFAAFVKGREDAVHLDNRSANKIQISLERGMIRAW